EDTAANLFASWKAWAELNGETPGSHKQFAEKLQSRGFKRKSIGHAKARGYGGIRVPIPGLADVGAGWCHPEPLPQARPAAGPGIGRSHAHRHGYRRWVRICGGKLSVAD